MTDTSKISEAVDLRDLTSVKLQALWALDSMSDGAIDRYTAADIADYLVEKCHTNTSRQAITSSFAKERRLVSKTKSGYKLMQAGRDTLANSTLSHVHVIKSGEPFQAKNVVLRDIFKAFQGAIQICDPYVDIYTLDLLFKLLDKKTPIRILTQNLIDKPQGIFGRHLGELQQDGFQIEIRKYSKSVLHDRYIIDDKTLWLSGNSLNHLGNKESFLVKLGSDTRGTILATFNSRWKSSPEL